MATPLSDTQVAEELKKKMAPEFVEAAPEEDEEAEKVEKVAEKPAPRRYYGCGRY